MRMAIAMINVIIFSSSLRELNELKINPVTTARDDKIHFMPNLLRAYMDMNGISIEEMKIGVTQLPVPLFYSDINI